MIFVFKYCLVYLFPSVDPLTERTWVSGTDWNISQPSKRTKPINASDWQICKTKQELYDFSTISYGFVHIVMLIIIQMYFVLATVSLLFVWEGTFE